MAQLLKNNVSGTLATQLNAANTSMVLVDASNFPSPAGSDFYLLTLVGLNTNGQEATWEVVKVIAKASNTMTVVRAQEGTTAAIWPVGATVQLRLTADSVVTPTALDASIAAHVAALDPHPTYTTASEAAAAAPVQSVAGRTGAVTLAKADVGLGSVDNTTDLLKPISTATQAALNGNVAITTHAATAKTTPTDADELGLSDSAASWGLKKLTFANLKAWISSLGGSGIANTPSGNISATTVQAAINELDSEKFDKSGGVISGRVSVGYPMPAWGVAAISATGAGVSSLWSNGITSGVLHNAYYAAGYVPTYVAAGYAGHFAFNSSGAGGAALFVAPSGSAGAAVTFTEALTVSSAGQVSINSGLPFGYGYGSSGTTTQLTSKNTGVVLNKPSGVITMNPAEMIAGTTASFQLTNSSLGASGDVLVVNTDGFFNYRAEVAYNDALTVAVIRVTNIGATRSDALRIKFAVIKGSA